MADHSRCTRAAAVSLLAVLLAGCGGSNGSTAITNVASAPHGLIAIGHSGLTGESSNPEQPHEDARENSWATGRNPAVKSIFQRMVALDPAAKDHVANAAEGGAKAESLATQAGFALKEVPTPQLAIIQTIDNDITCDGTDAVNAVAVGASLKRALDVIVTASPRSRVLVPSQIGRPLEYATAMAATPGAVASNQGDGPCDLFDPQGRLSRPHVAHLTAVIELYERQLKRVCLTVPQCHFDNGAFTRFRDRPDYFPVADPNHLNVAGQAAAAAVLWPTVAQVLRAG